MLNESELESVFSEALGLPVILSISSDETDESELLPEEKIKFAKMTHLTSKSSFLRGRKALRSICRKLALLQNSSVKDELEGITMPHPRFSLSHSGDLAVAVSCLKDTNGIGVDLELHRTIKEGATRFFLSETERISLEGLEGAELNENLLRLWTVKESLFKSDLANHGKTVLMYQIDNPISTSGGAYTVDEVSRRYFQYASFKMDPYWLTVSVATGGRRQ